MQDHIAKTVYLLMMIANVFDKKGMDSEDGNVTITNWEIGGLGYRTLTSYLRNGIEVINNLQREIFHLEKYTKSLKMELKEAIVIEDLSEENQEKARAYVEKLRKKEEEEENSNDN